MSNKLIKWNNSDHEPDQELDDSMLPADPPGYTPTEVHQTQQSVDIFVDTIQSGEEQEEQDDAMILSNARLRLEQGRLYEMLMTTDVFQNLEADEQAIKNVQRELKRFAKDRMEVMLGMKKVEQSESTVFAQFNSLEVEVLKVLAKKLSGGASEHVESSLSQPPKSTSLTPISGKGTRTTKASVKNALVPSKSKEPVKEPVLTKKIEDMSYDEKIQHAKNRSAIYESRKTPSPTAIPMPSIDGSNNLAALKAGNAASNVASALLRR